jgi:hypothetical protein
MYGYVIYSSIEKSEQHAIFEFAKTNRCTAGNKVGLISESFPGWLHLDLKMLITVVIEHILFNWTVIRHIFFEMETLFYIKLPLHNH